MVQKLMTEYNGFFISGKFDQFKGDAPMSAPLMAFRSLLQQLLRESENKIAVWRQDVLQAVGVHGKLLTDVIPNWNC
jgi:predicted ATPase